MKTASERTETRIYEFAKSYIRVSKFVYINLLQGHTGLEDCEIGGAVLLGGGTDAARGDIDDEGGETLEEFVHRYILQQHAGIEIYPLGLAAR